MRALLTVTLSLLALSVALLPFTDDHKVNVIWEIESLAFGVMVFVTSITNFIIG